MDKDTTMMRYSQARRNAGKMARVLRDLDDPRWADMHNCSRYLALHWCVNCGHSRTVVSNSCKHRLCPICAVRRSRKLAGQAEEVFKEMRRTGALEGTNCLLLTMTQKNCAPGALDAEIDGLLAAFRSLYSIRVIRRGLVGMARNVEVTYNAVADTWHPHVHAILIVNNSEYAKLSSSRWWREAWRTVMGLDYDPICDIRPLDNETGAVYEVSKYVSKFNDLLNNLPISIRNERINELNTALSRRRLISYAGEWRAARQSLNQVDVESAPLDSDDIEEAGAPVASCRYCNSALHHAIMVWDGCKYVDSRTLEAPDDAVFDDSSPPVPAWQ